MFTRPLEHTPNNLFRLLGLLRIVHNCKEGESQSLLDIISRNFAVVGTGGLMAQNPHCHIFGHFLYCIINDISLYIYQNADLPIRMIVSRNKSVLCPTRELKRLMCMFSLMTATPESRASLTVLVVSDS